MYRIIVTEPAEYDLINIETYIRQTLRNPEAAIRTGNVIINTLETLYEMPERQPLVNDELLAGLGIRLIQANNYNIFYEIDGEDIYIIRILYNRSDWQHIISE